MQRRARDHARWRCCPAQARTTGRRKGSGCWTRPRAQSMSGVETSSSCAISGLERPRATSATTACSAGVRLAQPERGLPRRPRLRAAYPTAPARLSRAPCFRAYASSARDVNAGSATNQCRERRFRRPHLRAVPSGRGVQPGGHPIAAGLAGEGGDEVEPVDHEREQSAPVRRRDRLVRHRRRIAIARSPADQPGCDAEGRVPQLVRRGCGRRGGAGGAADITDPQERRREQDLRRDRDDGHAGVVERLPRQPRHRVACSSRWRGPARVAWHVDPVPVAGGLRRYRVRSGAF
jgi:hypothetical protein